MYEPDKVCQSLESSAKVVCHTGLKDPPKPKKKHLHPIQNSFLHSGSRIRCVWRSSCVNEIGAKLCWYAIHREEKVAIVPSTHTSSPTLHCIIHEQADGLYRVAVLEFWRQNSFFT